jgi:hypothetical protein
MKTFKQYYNNTRLIEEQAANKHLTHLEELILTRGQEGYDIAKSVLINLLSHLQGKSKNNIGVSTKWDGAPAIFVGRVDTKDGKNKFFINTKSIFNKQQQKNNFSIEDIINHNYPEGLEQKLIAAFNSLKGIKIKPNSMVQGDLMFTTSLEDSKQVIDGEEFIVFKPNTITYAVLADSDFGRQLANSNLGVIFHTGYPNISSSYHDDNKDDELRFYITVEEGSGDPIEYNAQLKKYNIDPKQMASEGVWVDDANFTDDTGIVTLTEDEAKQVRDLIKTADMLKVNYSDLPVAELNIYGNTEIKKGAFFNNPEKSYDDFYDWYVERGNTAINKVTTDKRKGELKVIWDKKFEQVSQRKFDIINIFKISKLLQQAKQIFVNKYNNAIYTTKHFIDNGDGILKTTSPEGYVAVQNDGNAVKLVDRLEFSAANFGTGKPADAPTKEDQENYITNPPTRGDFYGKGRFTSKSGPIGEKFNKLYATIISEQDDRETIALYPGGYKPPTKGHYHSFDYILQDADRGVIFIGKKERDGITAEQSKQIWEIYAKYLGKPVEVIISDVTPVKSVYDYADNNKDVNIIVGAGDKDDDVKRYAYFEKNIEKYPLVRVVKIPLQSEGISGTMTRELIASDIDKAIDYFTPEVLSTEDKANIKQILS